MKCDFLKHLVEFKVLCMLMDLVKERLCWNRSYLTLCGHSLHQQTTFLLMWINRGCFVSEECFLKILILLLKVGFFLYDKQIQWFTKYNKSLATYMRTVGLDLTQVITIIMACLVRQWSVKKEFFFPVQSINASRSFLPGQI